MTKMIAFWSRRCLLLFLFLLGALPLLNVSAFAQTPEVGGAAPDFSLSTPEGSHVRLSDLTKKGVVVLVVLRGFPGYQCPYCQKAGP